MFTYRFTYVFRFNFICTHVRCNFSCSFYNVFKALFMLSATVCILSVLLLGVASMPFKVLFFELTLLPFIFCHFCCERNFDLSNIEGAGSWKYFSRLFCYAHRSVLCIKSGKYARIFWSTIIITMQFFFLILSRRNRYPYDHKPCVTQRYLFCL